MNDEKKNMCDEDDSDEILEYTGGSELSDLTFQTGYENYSQWRIKEILKEVGFRLEPLYVGYKALRYRPCQRNWVTYINEIPAAKIGYFFGFAFFSGNEKPTLNCSSSTSEASKALPFLPLKPLISPVLRLVTSSTICLSESCLSHLLRNMVSVQSTLEHFATFG